MQNRKNPDGPQAIDGPFPNIRRALFPKGTPLSTLVIDAEEDFNWVNPVYGTKHSVINMMNISTLQGLTRVYGLVPTYLLTYPVLRNKSIVEALARLRDRGQCDLGVQLHPWVTPPFDTDSETPSVRMSFAGNLPPDVEERKLLELCREFRSCFGTSPQMYRAGRYGLGTKTHLLLEQLGFRIDTSLAPRTDFSQEGGPDYTAFGYTPFWFGSPSSRILEIPLCREIAGWTGRLAPRLYWATASTIGTILKTASVASWIRAVERITLSPEGNDAPAMKRLLRALHRQGSSVFVVSFHSSSLLAGLNPYVKTRSDLHSFYDRLSDILSFMTDVMNVKFVKLADLREFVQVAE